MAHILIIDDDDLMNEMLSSLVKTLGHDATSAFTLGRLFANLYLFPHQLKAIKN